MRHCYLEKAETPLPTPRAGVQHSITGCPGTVLPYTPSSAGRGISPTTEYCLTGEVNKKPSNFWKTRLEFKIILTNWRDNSISSDESPGMSSTRTARATRTNTHQDGQEHSRNSTQGCSWGRNMQAQVVMLSAIYKTGENCSALHQRAKY